jgi:hypothetical protein
MDRIPKIPYITNEWVSASKTRNYILRDPLIDWLNMYGRKKGYIPDDHIPGYDPRLNFGKYIMNQGCLYEENIMIKLRNKFGDKLVEIKNNKSFTVKIKETIKLMNAGTPIISQGMIFNLKLKVYGIPDLIVRSDYINLLTDSKAISKPLLGCSLSSEWHYRVVDIKFSTLKFKADLTTLLNCGSQKAYKTQLDIYNQCVGELQGYTPKRSYIMGRGWDATKKGVIYKSSDPFSKLGIVDYSKQDIDVLSDTIEAVEWIRKLTIHGENWDITSEKIVPELYPNMCNENSTGWDQVKHALSIRLKEITIIWQCGVVARDLAHAKNIFRWDDPTLTSEILGIKGPKTGPIVNNILKINREDSIDNVYPLTIKSNLYDWRELEEIEFYIDFETVNSIYNLEDNSCNVIYMIGIGCIINNEWIYKVIISDDLSFKSEEKIVREFLQYIGNLTKMTSECGGCSSKIDHTRNIHLSCNKCTWNYCPDYGWWDGLAQCQCSVYDSDVEYTPIKLWHYSAAEFNMLNSAFSRINFEDDLNTIKTRLELQDLLMIVKDSSIVIKGAFNYSLKSIVHSLHSLGKIEVSYDNCKITSGSSGLLAAIIAVNDVNAQVLKDHELIKDTIVYNEIDCKSLYEILRYFRQEM